MELALKEAARSGNTDALYQLFREDPYVLEHIDQIPFIDTPLHTAAAAGQIDFAVEMLNLKPSFASKLNPDGFTPMHLALQNHQYQLLYELLRINNDLVRVKGKRGMTLLHYAAKEGGTELLAKFLVTCPRCITDVTVGGKTALHIAAESNQYEALELLARWLRRTHNKNGRRWEPEIMNWKDKEGNTVLHVAASNTLNQEKMIKLLLECGVEKNIINLSGLTALDILQRGIHFNRKAVGILSQAGGLNAEDDSISKSRPRPLADLLREKVEFPERLMILVNRTRDFISSETRNVLLVVAGLVITATYQAILNPPGGVRQAEASSIKVPTAEAAGRSVMDARRFVWFYIPNTASFVTTMFLTVIFLMIGPNGEAVLLPVVPLCVCYLMSTLVIAPVQTFTYFWLTFGIIFASACCIFVTHIWWLLKVSEVDKSSGEINKSVLAF